MQTWVIYHRAFPLVAEIAVEEVPDKIHERDVIGALDERKIRCSRDATSLGLDHDARRLNEAPQNVQDAYRAGQVRIEKWDSLWHPTT